MAASSPTQPKCSKSEARMISPRHSCATHGARAWSRRRCRDAEPHGARGSSARPRYTVGVGIVQNLHAMADDHVISAKAKIAGSEIPNRLRSSVNGSAVP